MASTDTSSVLRRMLAKSPEVASSGVDLAFKPLAALIEKRADKAFSLAVSVTSITQAGQSRDATFASFEAPAVMLRLREVAGGIAMAGLCTQLRAALIEVQTTGKVASSAPPDRRATDADAAICGDFVADILAQAKMALPAERTAFWAAGWTPDGHFTNPRALALAIDDVPLAMVMLQLDLGNGARQGTLTFLVPQGVAKQTAQGGLGWQAAMQNAVNDAPVPLRAVLHRTVISLEQAQSLTVGDTIALPRAAASMIMLEAAQTRIGPFKLGQISGQKALRRVPDHPPPPVTAPDPEPAQAPSLTLTDTGPD